MKSLVTYFNESNVSMPNDINTDSKEYNHIENLFKGVKTFGDFFIALRCYFTNSSPVKSTVRNLLDALDTVKVSKLMFKHGDSIMKTVSMAYYGDKNKINDIDDFTDFIVLYKNDEVKKIDVQNGDKQNPQEYPIILTINGWKNECEITSFHDSLFGDNN